MKTLVAIFGDICPDNNYRKLFDSERFSGFSDEIVQLSKNAGLTIGNLECPATENTIAISKCGPSLKARPRDISTLATAGFNVLSLANNHVLDYGIKGVLDTLDLCELAGIETVGVGKNSMEASQSLIREINGKRIGIISFAEAEFNLATETTPGANHFDPYASFEQVESLKNNCDYVIVLYHGGIEYYKYPSPLLQKKCRMFVKSGADLVLCQHSHCIGTQEHIGDSTILYGQGNSLFGYRNGDETWNEGLLVLLDKDLNVSFKLLKATPYGVRFSTGTEERARIARLNEDSLLLDDNQWLKSSWIKFVKSQESLDMPLLYGWNRIANKLNRLFKNRLIERKYHGRKMMITMNLIRCEAHHEVIQSILEDEVLGAYNEVG